MERKFQHGELLPPSKTRLSPALPKCNPQFFTNNSRPPRPSLWDVVETFVGNATARMECIHIRLCLALQIEFLKVHGSMAFKSTKISRRAQRHNLFPLPWDIAGKVARQLQRSPRRRKYKSLANKFGATPSLVATWTGLRPDYIFFEFAELFGLISSWPIHNGYFGLLWVTHRN